MSDRAVIFDYYGTLAYLDDGRHVIWQSLRDELNIDLSNDELDRRWLNTAQAHAANVRGDFVTLQSSWTDRGAELLRGLDLEPDGDLIARMYDRVHATAPLFPEVEDCLAKLRTKYRVGLLSNADTSHLMPSLESNSLHFNCVVYSEQMYCYKPDPRIFVQACAELNVDASAAIYVGDSPHADVDGASGAGIKAVWVDRNSAQWPSDILAPDAKISDLALLPFVVDELFLLA